MDTSDVDLKKNSLQRYRYLIPLFLTCKKAPFLIAHVVIYFTDVETWNENTDANLQSFLTLCEERNDNKIPNFQRSHVSAILLVLMCTGVAKAMS